MRKSPAVLVLSLVLTGAARLCGNPGHEVTIAELNVQIQQSPNLPELYFQRAWNFREIGKPAEARSDWEKTLELSPAFLPASRELARADAAVGKADAGIARLRQAMAAAPADQTFHLPGCHSVLAELLLKQNHNDTALEEAEAGLVLSPELQLDLCLLKSEAQRRLGLLDDRVRDLSAAMQKLRSFIVKTKWYDAMIDAERGVEILPEIEAEISNTRYQASWLIRRARIRQHMADATGAAKDLNLALEEIKTRLRPDGPDLSLVCDRGVILVLQGNHQAAAGELALARQLGADFWMTLSLESFLTKSGLGGEAESSINANGAEPDAGKNKNSGDSRNE